jgi:hypothetical protein
VLKELGNGIVVAAVEIIHVIDSFLLELTTTVDTQRALTIVHTLKEATQSLRAFGGDSEPSSLASSKESSLLIPEPPSPLGKRLLPTQWVTPVKPSSPPSQQAEALTTEFSSSSKIQIPTQNVNKAATWTPKIIASYRKTVSPTPEKPLASKREVYLSEEQRKLLPEEKQEQFLKLIRTCQQIVEEIKFNIESIVTRLQSMQMEAEIMSTAKFLTKLKRQMNAGLRVRLVAKSESHEEIEIQRQQALQYALQDEIKEVIGILTVLKVDLQAIVDNASLLDSIESQVLTMQIGRICRYINKVFLR